MVLARGDYVAARFDRRKRRPPPLSSPRFDAGGSVSEGFFGFRSVGKILMTPYVIAAARPTMAEM